MSIVEEYVNVYCDKLQARELSHSKDQCWKCRIILIDGTIDGQDELRHVEEHLERKEYPSALIHRAVESFGIGALAQHLLGYTTYSWKEKVELVQAQNEIRSALYKYIMRAMYKEEDAEVPNSVLEPMLKGSKESELINVTFTSWDEALSADRAWRLAGYQKTEQEAQIPF